MDSDNEPYADDKQNDETKSTNVLERRNLLDDEVSDDMFSDDDKHVSPVNEIPKVQDGTNCLNTDENFLIETVELVPREAFVPHTPMSLAPLINKCDQSWTSDMETPVIEPKKNVVTPANNQVIEQAKELTASPIIDDETSTCSPVFVNKKKKRPKRRIFKTSESMKNAELTDVQHDQTHDSTDGSENISSCTERLKVLNSPDSSTITEMPTASTSKVTQEVQNSVLEKLNTSSQDFFNNASFSMVDQICYDHAENVKSEFVKKDQTTVELLKSCRQKLKSRWSTSSLNESILQSSMDDDSAEQEILSLKPTNPKTSVSKMPSGVTATQLLSQISETKDSEASDFEKPTDVSGDSRSNIENTEIDEKNLMMNSTGIETQLIACCDLAEFTDDIDDFWPGQSESRQAKQTTLGVVADTVSISSGFKTASGQSISIDQKKLQHVTKLYEEFMQTGESLEPGDGTGATGSTSISTGFKSAGGTGISIDRSKLVRAQTLYSEISETDSQTNNSKKISIPTGFKTAGGTSISVDKSKIVRAQTLYNEVLETDLKTKNPNDIPISTGFKTAARTSISIDKSKLDKAQSLCREFTEPTPVSEKQPTTTVSSGFKTAAGGAISIKKNALDRIKTLFKDDLDSEPTKSLRVEAQSLCKEFAEPTPVSEKQSTTTVSSGFKTAGGGAISIKKNALDSVKTLFKDDLESEPTNKLFTTGFKTASGGDILIDKKNFVKAKQSFQDEDEKPVEDRAPVKLGSSIAGGKNLNSLRDNLPSSSDKVKSQTMKSDEENSAEPKSDSREMMSIKTSNALRTDEHKESRKTFETAPRGLKRKWLSDSDMSSHSTTNEPRGSKTIEFQGAQTKSNGNLQQNTRLEKSVSMDNCFDFDTDFVMSTINIPHLLESSSEETSNVSGQILERFSTYPMTSNTAERVTKRFSLPETNLRKRAIRNSTNAVINQIPIHEEFRGFSQEEIQESVLNREKIDSYLSSYTFSLNASQIRSSQFPFENSLVSNQIYFSGPSSCDSSLFNQSSQVEVKRFSSENRDRIDNRAVFKSNSDDLTKIKSQKLGKTYARSLPRLNYDSGMKFISGKTVTRSEAILNNIADPSPPPCLGFSPPKDHPMKILHKLIVNLENHSSVTEGEDDSPAFDFRPGVNTSKESLDRAKELLAYWKVEESEAFLSSGTKSAPGLQTASQPVKKLRLSIQKSPRAQTFHQPFNLSPSLMKNKSIVEAATPVLSSGFKTAAGKSISVSRESMKKATSRLMLEDDGSSKMDTSFEMPFSGGFKTAAGTSIGVSKESMERARKLMDLEQDTYECQRSSLPNTPSLGGFRTAAGKSIGVSEQSLEKARKLFECDMEVEPSATPVLGGFRTAGGQSINISRDNLEKAKKMFSGFEDETNSDTPARKRLSLNQKANSARPLQSTSRITSSAELAMSAGFASKRKLELDNDTPTSRHQLTRLKKPRVSSHVQARAIFNEESCVGRVEELQKQVPEKEQPEPSASESTPTSPIVGHKRRKLKKKVVAMSRTIQENEKEVAVDPFKRHSLPLNFARVEKREEFVCTFDRSDNVEEDRLAASLLQDKIINMKKRNKPKPVMGSLLSYRTENKHRRTSWKCVSGGKAPVPKTVEEIITENLDEKIIDVTSSNAASYSFHISDIAGKNNDVDNVISVNLPDGVRLMINETGQATLAEFRRAFLACPGVDPSLIPVDWIDNHYGLIVWKLASIDRMKFDDAVVPKALTPSRVIEELKYRYDREIDRSQRSALRKIIEKDETASKRMVLCVYRIEQLSDSANQEKDKTPVQSSAMRKIIVTDGWYTVPITFDIPMLHYVMRGLIKEGTKIVTYGAELQNCERGCHPLEKDSSVSLKIHSNATRRARWDTKLGFQRNAGPFLLKLRNVDPNSGLIGKLTVVISRIFPVLYREKLAGGQSVFRNARCEEKAVKAYEQECEKQMEKFYAKAQQDFLKNSRGDSQGDWDDDDGTFSESQSRQAQAHRRAKQEEFKQKLERDLRANLPPCRQVTPVLKLRVADEDVSALVTIWSGNEDVSDSLKEGSCVSIYNASASGRRNGELHLSINSFSFFKTESSVAIPYPIRIYTPITDLHQPNFKPAYNEFDTVGIVSSITDAPRGMKNFDVVNIAYPVDDMMSKYLSLYFWQGVSTSGYNNVLVKGSIIACSNLEWRCNSSLSIPAGYYNEKTSISCNPRQPHLREPFEKLKKAIKSPMIYATKCAEEIAQEFEKMSALKHASNPGTPSDRSTYSNSPQTSGLQNRSDNQTPVRTNLIQKRLEKLSRYGEAPNLSPIMTQSSSRVKSEFIPLQRTPNPN